MRMGVPGDVERYEILRNRTRVPRFIVFSESIP